MNGTSNRVAESNENTAEFIVQGVDSGAGSAKLTDIDLTVDGGCGQLHASFSFTSSCQTLRRFLSSFGSKSPRMRRWMYV